MVLVCHLCLQVSSRLGVKAVSWAIRLVFCQGWMVRSRSWRGCMAAAVKRASWPKTKTPSRACRASTELSLHARLLRHTNVKTEGKQRAQAP
jgi:hypothetical protein